LGLHNDPWDAGAAKIFFPFYFVLQSVAISFVIQSTFIPVVLLHKTRKYAPNWNIYQGMVKEGWRDHLWEVAGSETRVQKGNGKQYINNKKTNYAYTEQKNLRYSAYRGYTAVDTIHSYAIH
jgi:hypothetical protein